MNVYDAMAVRRSVRAYGDAAVADATVLRVLEAARLAPSACNKQPWQIYVVRAAETRAAMFPDARQAWIAAAPVVLVVCSRPGEAWVRKYDEKNHADVDASIAMEHLILAATAEGLGTCWICAFDPAVVRTALELPAELSPVAITPLGVPAELPEARPRKGLEEVVVWR